MTVRFQVRAEAEPQCLPRLIDYFAQRGLIPSAVSTTHIGRALDILIEHRTMDDEVARLICDRIARLPSVECATVSRLQTR